MKISTQVKTKWMQFKVSALSASVTALIVSSIPTQISASDIDIYQAGGTGAINIYFMLDASSSMWSSTIASDYKATSSKNSDFKTYTQKDSGGHKLTINEVGYGLGSYVKDGRNNKYIESPGGNYSIAVSNADKDTKKIDRFDLSTASQKYSVCSTYVGLSHDRKINHVVNNPKDDDDGKAFEFIYAKQGNPHCVVNVSTTYWNLSDSNDKKYINKVKEICEQDSTNTNIYYCLSRLANLKKGVMQVVLDEAINEEHNFAVGQYPKQSNKNGAETKIGFTNLGTFASKALFIDAVESIENKSSTPISYGYTEAVSKLQSYTSSSTNTKASCSGNGVYLLTDGEPNDTDSISSAINGKTEVATTYWANKSTSYWKKMAQYAIELREDKKLRIKTATVGLGGGFYTIDEYARDGAYSCADIRSSSNTLTDNDKHHQNLCYVGTKQKNNGMGGFYNAQSAKDIVDSIDQFVNDVTEDIEGTTMGTSTIPVDALNPTQLQNYSYFPMFQPIVGGDEQLWAGNLKKFSIKTSTGVVVDKLGNSVFNGNKIQEKLTDYWYESAGSSEDDVYMAWGGLLSKLKVHHKPLVTSGTLGFNRNVYLDFGVNSGDDLKHAVRDILNGSVTLDNKQYLYGLLGYSKLTQSDFDALASKSYNDQVNYLQTKITNQDFQMGSVIHSTPIMLTQKGIFEEKDGEYGISEREDYILAGTTQGLVQVVNAENGKEVFSFLPSEFLTRSNKSQEKGFAESLAMNRYPASESADIDNFFYGVDGPWVAHTEYEYSFEGDKEIMTAKKQYAYGGLRMGGRSYYALDLTDLGKTSGKPKLLFTIKPDDHETGALSYMGESWSKPVITYIPWKGQKRLAMIVGGGYDRKYEQQLSNADLSGKVDGNGIYIFAAEDLDTNTKAGTLLWWGSSNATSKDGAIESTEIEAMTHSIPSRVKAVDRNGDGITDHLYVGDLGGQVFRIDFNSKLGVSAVNTPLVYQAVKIADLNTPGKSPRRFYEAPTFTIHKDDNGKRFAMVTLASGDRSSPLDTGTSYPQDYVVAIKDDTVTSSPIGTPTLITLDSMHDISGTGSFNKGTHKGWFFPMPKSSSKQVRGIEEGIAIDNDLYYSVFNPDASTATEDGAEDCTGGVTGKSIAYKFCLPYGDKTCLGTSTSTNPEKIGELGAGIIGLTLGAGRSQATNRTLIFNKDIDPKPPEYAVSDKLVPKRWFEYLPFNSGGD
ncbi:pilus assembly protein [Acinetobacter gandensis]|uniref:pilus assembly protein n=1 Tax=Acinetobacter gandensis TaxID=1443941 RepID=UPI000B1B9A2E|nr:PilC/PilY family type IV pilus protein [Acinetobacter gandensis]